MIEVRIRRENEPTTHAVRLCEIPLDDIESLIESITEHGVFFDGEMSNTGIGCQWVYYNAEAYFELVIVERTTTTDESELND